MHLTDYDNARIINYLGGKAERSEKIYRIDNSTDVVFFGASETMEEVYNRYSFRYSEDRFKHLHRMYINQAQRIVFSVDPMAQVAVYPDDLHSDLPVPVLTKSRKISATTNCVLLPLNYERHWGDIPSIDRLDKPFSEKADRLVWRGATTGNFILPAEPYSSRAYVSSIDTKYLGVDIGFNKVVQIPENWPFRSFLESNLKTPMSLAEQLNCKFLLSLEGNDVASGLKWMLYSNSAVVMPAPICETWACESLLVPYQHYIPVAYDLSDLDEVFEWCLAHQSECEEIANNGRKFIQQFLDMDKERVIQQEVIRGYLDAAKFEVKPHGLSIIDNGPDALRSRAFAWLSQGEKDKARVMLRLGCEMFPDLSDEYGDPIFMKDLIKDYLHERDFESAQTSIAQLRGGREGWHNILFARAFENVGDFERAESFWREFLRIYPAHPEAQAAVRRCVRS